MRRLLIVSPHFPPVNAPDMQRVRQCLPYLNDSGWEAEVLTVRPEDVAMPHDPWLASTLPSSVPIHRVAALPLSVTRHLGIGSLSWRAHGTLGRMGNKLLHKGHFDLVFFSTTQFSFMTLGAEWLQRFHVPYVVDWQDPWVTDYYSRPDSAAPPGGWKYRVAAWRANRLEGPVLQRASGLVSTSSEYVTDLRKRYPWFKSTPTAIIPFGAEPADYSVALKPEIPSVLSRRAGVRHLVYVGAAGPIMRPALEHLFTGIHRWLVAHPDERAHLRLHFIGTSYAPAGRQVPSVMPLAIAAGLGDIVEESTARVGYFTALKTLREADALLLLGSAETGYSPSKIATLAQSGKPVLCLIPGGGQLETQLHEAGFDYLAPFIPNPDYSRIEEFLSSPPHSISSNSSSDSTASSRTRQLLEFFAQIVRH